MPTALYLHIPFCRSKCPYCAFVSFSAAGHLQQTYLGALANELRRQAAAGKAQPLTSLFIGGGTPTVLAAEDIAALVVLCRTLFGFNGSVEVSVEANPGTIDEYYLEQLLCAGVNRLSLGFQTMVPAELLTIGRVHSAAEALSAFAAARRAGFTDINLDLMYGLPGQTAASWEQSLVTALSLLPEHSSLYQLTLEPGTPLHDRYAVAGLPDEETILAMDQLSNECTAAAGLHQYEIANYARPGKCCRHNLNYWHNGHYLAAGVSAVSFCAGVREKRLADPGEYIARINSGAPVVVEREELPREASFRETVVVGLRLMRGVCRKQLIRRYGLDPVDYYGAVLTNLIGAGQVALADDRLLITDLGRPFSNRIMAELV